MTVRVTFVVMLFAIVAAPCTAQTDSPAAEAELQRLLERAGSGNKLQVRQEVLVFQQKHYGTTQAVKAAALLRDLPSPLDQLDAKAIPALEKFDWHPKETVAIVGEHRGRQGGAVTSVLYSRNGKWLVSGSTNGYVRVWDPTTMRLVHTFGHSHGAYCLAFTKDNTTLAHGGGDGQVRLWHMAETKPKDKGLLKVASTPLYGVAFSPSGKWLAAGGSDTRLYLWDLSADPPREATGANAHTGTIHAVAYSPSGNVIASGGADKTIRLWTVNPNNDMVEKASIEAHAGAVLCLAFHPTEDKTLLSGGADGVVRVWNVGAKLTPRSAVKLKHGAVNAVAFSASGKTVAAAFADGAVRTWGMGPALLEKATLEGHKGATTGVSFSPDGTTIASGSADWTVRQWPAVSGPKPRDKTITRGHLSHVYALAFAPDGAGLASGSYDATARLWDLAAAEPKEQTPSLKADAAIYTLAFAPDGKQVAAAGGAIVFRSYDCTTGRVVNVFSGHTGHVARIAWSPDGRFLASAANDKTARLWNARTGKSEGVVTAFETFVNGVAFSPDARQLACTSGHYLYDKNGQIVIKNSEIIFNDSTVRLYEMPGLKETYRYTYDKALMGAVTFTPDGRLVLAGSSDTLLRQWDAQKPATMPDIAYKGGHGGISTLACSPDGRWLATYGPDHRVQLFDLATKKKVREWILGEQYGSIAFAPDSRHLAVGVGTGVVMIWRLASAKP